MTRSAEKLLAAMRRRPAGGWKWRDLDRLYSKHGFVRRKGGKHTTYTHPKHPHLQAAVSRKRPEQFTDDSWGYMARVTELPGCECHGDTPDEARADLEQVKALFLETMLGNGLTPPEPSRSEFLSKSA